MKIWNTSRELIEWLDHHHAPMHETGGVDEINVGGLSGDLADLQDPKDHTHASAGSGVGGQLDWDNIWSDAVHDHSSAGEGNVIPATSVEVQELSTATYDDVQDYINFFGDRTLLSGGGISARADALTGVNTGGAGLASFEISGDLTAIYKENDIISVNGSTANDGNYTLKADSTHAGGTTTITVDEAVSDGTVDGSIYGAVNVASGTAWAKATDSDTALGKFFNFSADTVILTNLITNYIYLDYNAGTPQIVATTTSIITHGFKQDHIHIATIFRDEAALHFHEEDAIGIGRVNIVDMRLLEMHDADRASGLITTDATSLALNVSAGVVYEGLNRHTTAAQIPASWSTWHYNFGTSAWVETTSQTTIDNERYNPTESGTGLANLTSNRYAVHWVYVDIDGANLFIIYGQDNYTINQAEEAGVPALLPDIAVHYGVLIAKIVVQKSDTTLEILYPWTTTIHSSKATVHANLAGLGDDDHAQYILHSLADASGDFLVASGNDVFAKQTTAQALATLSPLTTRGDTMFRNATVSTRLAKGAANTLLVMGANDPAWSATLAGLTLTAPVINGTVTGTSLVLPAHQLAGALDLNAQEITNFDKFKSADSVYDYIGRTGSKGFVIYTENAANNAAVQRVGLTSATDIAIWTWHNVTHAGLKLSGNLLADNNHIIMGNTGKYMMSRETTYITADSTDNMVFYTRNGVGVAAVRLRISGGIATAVTGWENITHTGMAMSDHLTLHITDTDGTAEADIWYDASEDKLKFKTATGVETITSA